MQANSAPKNLTKTQKAIISTLSFFHIYRLPLSARRVWELLYRQEATFDDVQRNLEQLHRMGLIDFHHGLYAIDDWDQDAYETNLLEIKHRWRKVQKYYWLLSAIPFIENLSVINSVAMGNADHESDIDFFVVAKPNRLYFVRTVIIVLFKLLGVYKTRDKVNEQFCFGFYISSSNVNIKPLLLEGEDPYMAFWTGTIIPIAGEKSYCHFIKENKWIYSNLPNFRPEQRLEKVRELKPSRKLKKFLTFVGFIPAIVLEPLLRRYHIRHTFKLQENHWATSSTIANKNMLKLHALDPRKDLRRSWEETLHSIL
jgi:predicted nucleotidyltransferase